jgi:hypothetical protein
LIRYGVKNFRSLKKMANPDEGEDSLGQLKKKLADCISLVAKMSAIDRLAVNRKLVPPIS